MTLTQKLIETAKNGLDQLYSGNKPERSRASRVMSAEGHPDNFIPWEESTITAEKLFELIQNNQDDDGAVRVWPFSEFPDVRINRSTVVSYATLYRCVTLTASVLACLITRTLRVCDAKGNEINDDRTMMILELVRESHDGMNPAFQFWEDMVSDYCLDGNAIIHMNKAMPTAVPYELRRMRPRDAEVIFNRSPRARIYQVTEADWEGAAEERKPEGEIIHIRWPKVITPQKSSRFGFSIAPVEVLKPALSIGMRGDNYSINWYKKANKSKLHIDFELDEDDDLDDDEKEQIRKTISKHSKEGEPIITFGAKSNNIENVEQGRGLQDTRDFQTQEAARIFGIPSPLFGVDISRWGGAIDVLAKLYYRFGANTHLERFLWPMKNRLLMKGQFFRVNPNELLRGDSTGIAELLTSMQGDAQRNPVASREELRELAGLPRDVDGEIKDTVQPMNQMNGGGDANPE